MSLHLISAPPGQLPGPRYADLAEIAEQLTRAVALLEQVLGDAPQPGPHLSLVR